MRFWSRRDFVVVYKRRPVFVLEFKDEKYERWIIPAEPNEELVNKIEQRMNLN